jgi:hypothetical protein
VVAARRNIKVIEFTCRAPILGLSPFDGLRLTGFVIDPFDGLYELTRSTAL